jgi:hypothetical protein
LFKTEDNRSSFKKNKKSAGNPTTSGGMPSTFSNPAKNSDQRRSNFMDEFDRFEEQFEKSHLKKVFVNE